MTELIEYPDAEMMCMDLAGRLAGALRAALDHEARVTFAVPGGTTPGPVFDVLAAVDLEWERVDVILTDERWVPEDHRRSNARLVRERLLVQKAAAANFIPYFKPGVAPEDVIDELAEVLADKLPIDVLLLGMGADMHIASLFPGAPELAAALDDDAPPLAVIRPADQPEPRLTLTAPVLRGALETHIVITGEEKRQALQRARSLGPSVAPVAVVLDDALVHWAP